MADRVIDNPIINSPYDAPARHFVFDNDGITDEIADARRRSSYFVPIPEPTRPARRHEDALRAHGADQPRP